MLIHMPGMPGISRPPSVVLKAEHAGVEVLEVFDRLVAGVDAHAVVMNLEHLDGHLLLLPRAVPLARSIVIARYVVNRPTN